MSASQYLLNCAGSFFDNPAEFFTNATTVDITTVDALILDLLRSLAERPRPYADVMDAWRTSCPRFPIWEDANDRGLVVKQLVDGRIVVRVTSSGLALLEREPRARAM